MKTKPRKKQLAAIIRFARRSMWELQDVQFDGDEIIFKCRGRLFIVFTDGTIESC